MEKENLICKKCEISYVVHRTGAKMSNGAWERLYIENGFKAKGSRCYPCFHAERAGYYPEKQKQINRYEKTLKGYLMRKYRNMKSRIDGVQKEKWHLYKGKDLLPKEEFYKWALENEHYHKLHREWVDSGYDRKLAPSVDRIDSEKGYFIGNMEWVTHSENSRRGSVSGKNRQNQYTKNKLS